MARRSIMHRLKMQLKLKEASQEESTNTVITENLDENLETIKQLLGAPEDLVVRELIFGGLETRAAIVYINGLVDEKLINDNILKTIQLNVKEFTTRPLDKIEQEVIAVTEVTRKSKLDEVSLAILNGDTAFYLEGFNEILLMGTGGGERRAIQEPESETLIRGPREGFVESIQTNMALIRRGIKDSNLRYKEFVVGKRSQKKVVVCYIEGLTNSELVQEINRRIKSISIDYVPDSSVIEQWIEDSFLSPFPQLLDTERPDKITSSLMLGKVGILVEGSPFGLIAPVTFGDGLQSTEDFTQRWFPASLLRTLRYLAAFIAVFLPGLFVALVSYHPGMIPSTLAYSIAGSREGVPFPAPIEAVMMAVTFEILHEAGVRLPKVIGQTIGIVGGLVIGEAAVQAGIVSPIMVIVTALTAIAAFSIPSYSVSISFRLLRFAVILAAGLLGLYGVILIYIMINIHIANLKSFGIPYSTPFGPLYIRDLLMTIFRLPITKVLGRLGHMKPKDKQDKAVPNQGDSKK